MKHSWTGALAGAATLFCAQAADARLTQEMFVWDRPEDVTPADIIDRLAFLVTPTETVCYFNGTRPTPWPEVAARVIVKPARPLREIPEEPLWNGDIVWTLVGDDNDPLHVIQKAAGEMLVAPPQISEGQKHLINEETARLRFDGRLLREACLAKVRNLGNE